MIEHLYAEQVSLLSAVPKARQKPRWDVDEDEDNRKNSPAGPRHLIHQSPNGGEPARRSGAPSAVDVARQAGISTSFDLDGQVADDPSRLQALFYPEDLEKIARKISGAARTAIEETGSNLLHLIFGFLEWYESDDSEAARLAPLLTLTVNLQKAAADPATGIARYFLETAGGERLSANYCLEELLRQDFNLQLPTLRAIGEEGEIEAPESYLRRVEAVIASKERWKVRRQLTLGLLSFGKLLMHRDLDPQTWPAGDGPDIQARVRDLFEGISREGAPELSPEYPLDEPAMRARVPELVLDADSSQHSALIDALEGKNLVIQGPPGTGKSQTITNLIAAALVRGKSVLFVAEKLAALEVVRNRLDHINLGK